MFDSSRGFVSTPEWDCYGKDQSYHAVSFMAPFVGGVFLLATTLDSTRILNQQAASGELIAPAAWSHVCGVVIATVNVRISSC